MFTGIVTAVGEIVAVTPPGEGTDMRLSVATPPGWLAGVALVALVAMMDAAKAA